MSRWCLPRALPCHLAQGLPEAHVTLVLSSGLPQAFARIPQGFPQGLPMPCRCLPEDFPQCFGFGMGFLGCWGGSAGVYTHI